MPSCPACGQENPEQARFCLRCATPLEEAATERRKLATLLFCDMSGSTEMGERIDAESVRDLTFAYFHEMRGAIERHGGTVEKFVGDAVMAVFGVPTAHEDDALRAVRAAWEMQERLRGLNEELDRRFGARIALRIGVNTGEVVAGDAGLRQAIVSGDAVNVAARLEQAAAPGDVLVGEATFRLVRDAVAAEPVEPLALKGKSQRVPAYRLAAVSAGAPARARRLDTPMVGRTDELGRLRTEAAATIAEGRCRLVTIVGEPGVGKSRLAAELLAAAPGFRALSGRCLEYGEGITYWPIAEIVRQAAGIRDEHSREEALRRLGALLSTEDARTVAQAIGLAEGEATTDAIAAAVHELVAALAQRRPLLLLVDDLHWAEQALLDLFHRLPRALDQAPVFLIALARPELTEEHPEWEATLRLQPLDEGDSGSLVEQLLGRATLPEGLAARVAGAAAGNPLFVEELVGMLVDDGLIARRDGAWVATEDLAGVAIPPTLRELLGARLDRLPEEERAALERGAVEGQVFHGGAVASLSEAGDRAAVPENLRALQEREYLRPARAEFADEAAFRVRHVLIRDAAYEGIPKKVRASLHERFADWLEEKAGDRSGEYEEILGYHLEQTYRYREQLGPPGGPELELARRAAERLERAGRRAFGRRDSQAAANLLSRAAALFPDESRTRLELLQLVGEETAFMMDVERADDAFRQVLDGATAVGETPLAAQARIWRQLLRFFVDPDFGARELLSAVEAVGLEDLPDERAVARTYDWRAFAYSHLGRFTDSEREAQRAVELFRRVGDRRSEIEQFWYLAWAAASGPTPVEEAIERCEWILGEAGDDAGVEGHTKYSLATLEAKRGRFDAARELAERARAVFEETGMAFAAWYPLCRATIELIGGDEAAAERELRRSLEPLEAMYDFPSLTNAASLLADLLVGQGRLDEADELTARARDWAPKDQPVQHARWRAARARLFARRGGDEAHALAREAVELARQTDFLELQADCLVAFADVVALAGRGDDAVGALGGALLLYDRKGNVASANRTRALLAQLSSVP